MNKGERAMADLIDAGILVKGGDGYQLADWFSAMSEADQEKLLDTLSRKKVQQTTTGTED
jgi:hypothetical protein